MNINIPDVYDHAAFFSADVYHKQQVRRGLSLNEEITHGYTVGYTGRVDGRAFPLAELTDRHTIL